MDDTIQVGQVGGVFGIRGWLKINSHTRPADNILNYQPWLLGSSEHSRPFRVAESRRHHGGLIARFDGIEDRDAAAELLRLPISVLRSQLPAASPGEYYWSDLIGLSVINLQREALGEVAGLIETSAHDVLRVVADRERLIPYVSGVYVISIDLPNKQLVVDWHKDD